MKICSKIKNRDGKPRNIDVHGTRYIFASYTDNDGNEHHVADVKNEDHAAVFLASEHYYPLEKAKEKQSALKRDNNLPAPPAPPPASDFSEEIRAEAAALLQGSAPTIGQEIGKVSSMDVVSAAIPLEEAGQNRKSVLTLLKSTLQFGREAGTQA